LLSKRERTGKKKSAPKPAPLEVGSVFWGSREALEGRLDGSDRPRIAGMAILPLLLQALILIVVGIVVTDVGRPVV
jgi:hypothetical protein